MFLSVCSSNLQGTYVNSNDNKLVLKIIKDQFFFISGFYGDVIIKDKQVQLVDKGFGTVVSKIDSNQLILKAKNLTS